MLCFSSFITHQRTLRHDETFVSSPAGFFPSFVCKSLPLLLPKPHHSSFINLTNFQTTQPSYAQPHHRCITHTGSTDFHHIIMAPGATSTNDRIREYYAPRVTEPSTTKQRQSVPHVKHQKPQRPIVVHTELEDVDQGCLGEIKNYKAGDEFVLLWKWVDDFMDKRRAKKDSSKSHNVTKPTSRQAKPTTSSSHEARQNPKPAGVPSVGGVRRQVTDREDLCEYKTQSRAPWGRLRNLHQKFKDQRAKKKPDQARQKKGERLTGGQATERTDQSTRGHSTNHPQTTSLPPDQAHAVNRPLGIAEKPVSVYNKKRGEVQKHAVQITHMPPIHSSVHLEHTPSNNYRTKPPAALKNDSARDTHFSDFIREERGPVSRETKWTRAGPDHEDEPVRNSHFSSKLDPAKAIKRAKEVEKAKGPKCYICSSTHCPGGYRDNISKLWVCAACQQKENIGPKQCSYCGTPNSPNTTYADNGLWLCTNVSFSNPLTLCTLSIYANAD